MFDCFLFYIFCCLISCSFYLTILSAHFLTFLFTWNDEWRKTKQTWSVTGTGAADAAAVALFGCSRIFNLDSIRFDLIVECPILLLNSTPSVDQFVFQSIFGNERLYDSSFHYENFQFFIFPSLFLLWLSLLLLLFTDFSLVEWIWSSFSCMRAFNCFVCPFFFFLVKYPIFISRKPNHNTP